MGYLSGPAAFLESFMSAGEGVPKIRYITAVCGGWDFGGGGLGAGDWIFGSGIGGAFWVYLDYAFAASFVIWVANGEVLVGRGVHFGMSWGGYLFFCSIFRLITQPSMFSGPFVMLIRTL